MASELANQVAYIASQLQGGYGFMETPTCPATTATPAS